MIQKIISTFFSTAHRRGIDRCMHTVQGELRGKVLDIGGRDRGVFEKPKSQVDAWVFGDIVEEHNPDIVIDVMDMHNVDAESFDVIVATELFEHVMYPEKGVTECYRILKSGGTMIVSMPFMYPVHADPRDFQRFSLEKWKTIAADIGFTITSVYETGYFFTVYVDMMKGFVKSLPFGIRHLFYLGYPILHLVGLLDRTLRVKNNKKLSSYVSGYFLVLKK